MASVAELILRIQGKDEASASINDADQAVKQLARTLENTQAPSAGLTKSLYEVGEAGGNAEQGMRGLADIASYASEQLGLPLGPLQENAAALADLGGGVEAVLKGFPSLFAQISTAIPLILAKAAAWWAVAVATIAANAPIIAIIAGIALLAAGVILLIRHWDTIVEKVPLLGTAMDAVKNALLSAWGFIQGIFEDLEGAFNFMLDFVKEHWPEIAVLISGPFAPIVLLATDAFGVRSAIEDAIDFMLEFVKKYWPEIAVLISGPFFPIVALATDAFGVRTALQNAMTATKDFVAARIGDIVGFFTGLPGSITATFSELLTSATGIGSTIADGIVTGLKTITSKIGEIAGALKTALRGAIQIALDWLADNVRIDVPGFDPPGPGSIPGFSWGFPQINLPGLKDGMWKVPGFGSGDIFPALLQPGEMVVPRGPAEQLRNGGMGGSVTMNFYGPTNSRELRAALDEWLAEQAGAGAVQHGVVMPGWSR